MSSQKFPASAGVVKCNKKSTKHISYLPAVPVRNKAMANSAIIYCQKNFAAIDGKTANGLVRSSGKYSIISVIDSEKAGLDSGIVLDSIPNGIPVVQDLKTALDQAGFVPDCFIFGMAPATGLLSPKERNVIVEAMNYGMNIINGLHEFFNDDPIMKAASVANNVTITDVRKPPDKKDLRLFTGRVMDTNCRRIAVLGTDCAIGKRTTTTILTEALNECGVKAVMIATGQTGLIQGARYGIALDAIPSQFCAGELEATILEAYENEKPDIILVEGQGSLSHPAFSSSAFVLRGSCPHGVVLQHAPKRLTRCDFDHMAMPSPEDEIKLIESFTDTKVIGLTINHENMSNVELTDAIEQYALEHGVPATDPLTCSAESVTGIVFAAFPELINLTKSIA